MLLSECRISFARMGILCIFAERIRSAMKDRAINFRKANGAKGEKVLSCFALSLCNRIGKSVFFVKVFDLQRFVFGGQ